jgi:hydroxypyruvate isomerase
MSEKNQLSDSIAPSDKRLSRRRAFAAGAVAAIAATTSASAKTTQSEKKSPDTKSASDSGVVDASKGRIKQAVAKWCYPNLSLNELAGHAAALGMVGIDLLEPKDFKTVKKHGLIATLVSSHKLANGLCEPKFHEECLKRMNTAIEATAAEGWRNVICFSGNARGIDRKTGMKNCVKALKEIVPVAEKAGVILNMELLNSKVDHPDYMCDNSSWGIELVKRVESDHFKLLYDIYHMQIMEGDVIRTIQDNHQHFGHYHTAGNPGRHELDESQELNYHAIAQAIAESGFDGYLAHEFRPTRDPVAGLKEAIECCLV